MNQLSTYCNYEKRTHDLISASIFYDANCKATDLNDSTRITNPKEEHYNEITATVLLRSLLYKSQIFDILC